ncbi:NAD-dependent epimerase/dehydratase family protein [Indiicoccus explosivorum]|uniref:NAD-dependent epimerase/dehydratase family protein n=1 Tax=Indiicoccus explosivorum TaxID=1917864 RepID=UPI000B434F5D|nr:NAD-dependent epimerase/dehydratase family protein [Indiicoccus explosivorum]
MNILITGKNSYAGKEFIRRMKEKNSSWGIDAISVRNEEWKKHDFSKYDAVYHVAAIVHLKEKPSMESEYYRVNTDLAFQVAKKAKNEGVKSFIFLSSIAVYGLLGDLKEEVVISKETPENPKTFNGKSKLAAEKLLEPLRSEKFQVAILRIPLIYGYKCPGNYGSLSKLAALTPVFPKIDNKRTMIFIDHLSDIVEHLISNQCSGLYLISNQDTISTFELVREVSKNKNKMLFASQALAWVIKSTGNFSGTTRKLFGTVYYKLEDTQIEGFTFSNISFEESISRSEGKK